ncbi:MAG: DUF423 domain-containing protein [Flavobacteriales bacterium]|nr:DUF423 domain-containing protein [Flavobacteriales bacterium]MCB9173464.1 DUF423 domain-containing protein [Flavobacteriales bacterium]
MNRSILIKGASLGCVAVILGALGAHALKNMLTPDQLASFEIGVKYQMYHAILLVALAFYIKKEPSKYISSTINLMFFGVILFSGSIYLLTLKNILAIEFLKFAGPITPIGGILLVIGWFLLILEGFKKN